MHLAKQTNNARAQVYGLTRLWLTKKTEWLHLSPHGRADFKLLPSRGCYDNNRGLISVCQQQWTNPQRGEDSGTEDAIAKLWLSISLSSWRQNFETMHRNGLWKMATGARTHRTTSECNLFTINLGMLVANGWLSKKGSPELIKKILHLCSPGTAAEPWHTERILWLNGLQPSV